MSELKVRIYQDPQSDLLTMVIFQRQSVGGRRYYGPKVNWEVKENDRVPEEVLWYLPGGQDTMQLLADALAEKGILPKGYVPTKAEIAATERHLDDMRTIVGKMLAVEFSSDQKPVLKGEGSMKVYLVAESYDYNRKMCLTLEIAQREAKKLRDEGEADAKESPLQNYSDIAWERRSEFEDGDTVEFWSLWGTRAKADGTNEVGRRYMLGPDVHIWTEEIIET